MTLEPVHSRNGVGQWLEVLAPDFYCFEDLTCQNDNIFLMGYMPKDTVRLEGEAQGLERCRFFLAEKNPQAAIRAGQEIEY